MSRRPPARVGRDWGEDDTGCPILHVDMDAFFASVELVRRPEVRGRPVIVGGAERGVGVAATYEARAFGVHSAMPMAQARRRCPQAVVLPPDIERYREVSRAVMALFDEVTDLVEQVSIDEAFLDVSGSLRRLGRPLDVARWIRSEVADRLQVTCSVGVADCKFVAKIASGAAKPDGLLLVPHAHTVDFLHTLPGESLWGVGERTREALARWGITTVAELAATALTDVQRAVDLTQNVGVLEIAGQHSQRTDQRQRKPCGHAGGQKTLCARSLSHIQAASGGGQRGSGETEPLGADGEIDGEGKQSRRPHHHQKSAAQSQPEPDQSAPARKQRVRSHEAASQKAAKQQNSAHENPPKSRKV